MERALRTRKQNLPSDSNALEDFSVKSNTNRNKKQSRKGRKNIRDNLKENIENIERSVLSDKTNSVQNKTAKNINKGKKVEFDLESNRNMQKQISDFFDKVPEGKSPKVALPDRTILMEKNTRLEEKTGAEEENLDKKSSSSQDSYVPVYKKQVGNASFHLTPPAIKDKLTLYEFTVDENEPKPKKKRTQRVYKKKPTACTKKDNSKKLFGDLPQKTLVLRGDNEKGKKELENKEENGSKEIRKICGVNETNPTITVSHATAVTTTQITPAKNKIPIIQITPVSNSKVCTPQRSITLQSSAAKSSEKKQNKSGGSRIDFSVLSLTPRSSVGSSPFPEYSRLDDGIQLGPAFASCRLNMNGSIFGTAVPASTPYKGYAGRKEQNICIRMSGGDWMNNSLDVDDDKEEYFGFRENENHDDSMDNIQLNTLKEQTVCVEKPQEPVEKISLQEVISLLKRDVGKTQKPLCFSPLGTNSPNTSQSSVNGERQPDEENTSFTKPPRRSYNRSRRAKRFNYTEMEDDEQAEEKEEQVQKKPQKPSKVPKISKKEMRQMEIMAEMMNSQFRDVDKFKLCVE